MVFLLFSWGSNAFAAQPEPVGQFGLVIGPVAVKGGNGETRPVLVGGPIYPGDVIETGPGEHAHLRFVDQGFVSVRPNSRLLVEAYDTAPDSVTIRFSLTHGTVRAITGEAAQARRERFRLNAPVAAIGIRGTDFVVRATDDALQAVVNSGAIVVAPFGSGCAVVGLGPCDTVEAVELSDQMGSVLLELNALQAPQIVPFTPVPGGGSLPQNEPPLERDLVSLFGQTSSDKSEDKLLLDRDAGVAPALPPTAPYPTQLAWGRWVEPARAGDDLTLSYGHAREARKITVGNVYAGLYRSEHGSELTINKGSANFSMAGAHVALLRHDGSVSAGQIDGGALSIDFANLSYSTSLTLSHAEAGRHAFAASGAIRDDGVFSLRSEQGRIAGAISADGREAGYMFEQQIPAGVFSGLTLWAR